MPRSVSALILSAVRLQSIACCLFLAGCTATNSIDYGKVTLVNVSGTVTLDGQPLAGALVTFESPETGTMSFARTNSSGSYTLQFDSEKDGVTPGTKLVRFSTTRTILGLRGEEGAEVGEASTEGPKATPVQEQVPQCYNGKSMLTVEITSETKTVDFDLKSDCSTSGAK
ncbi:MAG: carboxypeptidase-like regulatory domain-containing protein [Planctomycetota bacterium]